MRFVDQAVDIGRAQSGLPLDVACELLAEYLALRPAGGVLGLLPPALQAEVDTLPGTYAPPAGCLLLATVHEHPVGLVASACAGDAVSEMKRLYVRPSFRRRGIGRQLSTTAIDWARAAGYERMRLDVWPARSEAISIYRALGFREVAPFHSYPFPMVFMELELGGDPSDCLSTT
jgi:putative acetyltransferase